MKVLYLHGWHSTPGGAKPTYLKDHGHEVLDPALPDEDFDAAVAIAQTKFRWYHPDVVVGASRGGAVAMNIIESGTTPLVLLCPAWKRWGTRTTVKLDTVILHSRVDDVVPFSDSAELVRNSCLTSTALIEVGADHRLADQASLAKMLELVESFPKWVPPAAARIPEAGVPRRFGVGTLLLITTMYAVLFGILRAADAEPLAYVLIGLFFFAIGLAQMLLFKGLRPRRASVIGGICVFLAGGIVTGLINLAADFPGFVIFVVVVGAFYGYLAGLLIAGVFLIAAKLNRLIGRDRIGERAKVRSNAWYDEPPSGSMSSTDATDN